MKKLMLIVMIGFGTMLVGCGDPPSSENVHDKDNTWMPHGQCISTKVIEIEGHKYIIMVGFKCGGIIHAESCSCKK
jgi:hypothetical protein